MKAFESNNRSNLVRRETVTAGERAADIRSRISGWGNFAESNGYQVRTRIHGLDPTNWGSQAIGSVVNRGKPSGLVG